MSQGPTTGHQPLEIWEHAGLHCAMVANPRMGLINGYVQLPEGHPDRERGYDDIKVEVHGGLTYGPDEDGWVGFDTGHWQDWWAPDDLIDRMDPDAVRAIGPGGIGRLVPPGPDVPPWTVTRLRAEVEALAEQLATSLDRPL